jgi:hypothetical protein
MRALISTDAARTEVLAHGWSTTAREFSFARVVVSLIRFISVEGAGAN